MATKGDAIDLAEYRALRAAPRTPNADAVRVAVHPGSLGPSPRLAAHRRRMLRHLATLAVARPKAASES